MNIAVAGTGYVGLSIATLFAQHNHVEAVDIVPEKVEKIQYIGGFGLCELDDVFGNTLGGVIGWFVMWGIKTIQRSTNAP